MRNYCALACLLLASFSNAVQLDSEAEYYLTNSVSESSDSQHDCIEGVCLFPDTQLTESQLASTSQEQETDQQQTENDSIYELIAERE